MLYLNNENIREAGVRWEQITKIIRNAVRALEEKDFAQPVKPYLRYGNPANRIIAMPAFVGGETLLAGIKWVASFPQNVHQALPRAHSVIILNEAATGVPVCMLNATVLNGIRTAGVSGLMIQEYLKRKRQNAPLKAGITGFGPVGRAHLEMLAAVLGPQLGEVCLYDLNPIRPEAIPAELRDRVTVCRSWQEAFCEADIFITCTVSRQTYIDLAPKKGSLQLNVSLRDYKPEFLRHVDVMVVDDWEEVCRENTDIEQMHRQMGLMPEQTLSLTQFIHGERAGAVQDDGVVMFNPMGMAVFDIAVGGYYYKESLRRGIGRSLEAHDFAGSPP